MSEEIIFHTPATFPTIDPIPYWKPVRTADPYSTSIDHIKEASHDYQVQHDYLEERTDITHKMRTILINWLLQVATKFKLLSETYYLTVNIIDRFLARHYVPKTFLQLIGITAGHIASKFEEVSPPELNDWLHISANAFTKQQLLDMEKVILQSLEYKIRVSTPIHFLEEIISELAQCQSQISDRRQSNANCDETDAQKSFNKTARKALKHIMAHPIALEYRPSQLASLVTHFVNGRMSYNSPIDTHLSTISLELLNILPEELD